jgi:hypothetical protein
MVALCRAVDAPLRASFSSQRLPSLGARIAKEGRQRLHEAVYRQSAGLGGGAVAKSGPGALMYSALDMDRYCCRYSVYVIYSMLVF